jgi:geranylgeranyl diphosphate synthase type I
VDLDIEAAHCLLCERLLSYLSDLQPALRADIFEALAVEGKLFHRPASRLDGRWALLPLYLARALREEADPAWSVAAGLAMECLICATDLLDDVMDEDVTPLIERLGVARALNVALALLSLPQRILLALAEQYTYASLSACLLDAVQRALLLAVGGQQQDLLAEQRPACELSREDCIEIASAKAGSLLSLACRLGALCAGVEETLVERCAEMGRLLGIAAQLDNDAHDLSRLLRPTDPCSQKSDLRRGKKTLPVVLAARSLRETRLLAAREIEKAFQGLHSLTGEEREVYVSALRQGILATWGISLLYRERARDYLIEMMGGGSAWENVLQVLGFGGSPAEINDC